MVSNTSSLGADWNALKERIGDWGQSIGQAVGLVDGEVIPGDPDKLVEMAGHFRAMGKAFDQAGNGFRAITTDGWQGDAAEAARDYLDQSPKKWLTAADAFTDAGKALDEYAQVLRRAKKDAAAAKENLEQAKQDAENEAEQNNRSTGPPGACRQPTAERIRANQDLIDRARQNVRSAAQDATAVLGRVSGDAPDRPGWMARARKNLVDSFEVAGRVVGSVVEGVGSAAVETYKGLRTMNPGDSWNKTHPMIYTARMKSMGEAIVTDPYGTLKQSVDINGWKNDPGKSVGSLIPSLIGTAAGGSGIAAKVGSGLGKVGKTAGKLDDVPTGPVGKHVPDGNSRPSGPDSGNEPKQPPQRPERPQDHGPPSGPGSQGPPNGPGSQPNQPFGPGSQGPPSGPQQPPGPNPPPWARTDGPPSDPGQPPSGPSHGPPNGPDSQPDQPFGPGSQPDQPFGPGSQPDRPFGPGAQSDQPSPPDSGAGPQPHPDLTDKVGSPHTPEDGPTRPSPPNGPEVPHSPESDSPDPSGPDGPGQSRIDSPDDGTPEPGGRHHDDGDQGPGDKGDEEYRRRVETRYGTSWDEAVADLRADHPELDHLPDEEAMAVRRYVGGDASTINDTLRNGDAIDREYMSREVEHLREGLDKLPGHTPTPDNPVVYRNLHVSPEELPKLLERYTPGETVEEAGFTSASKEIPPEMFGDQPGFKRVEMVIDEPEHAADLEKINPDEREVLWKNDNQFTVNDVRQTSEGSWQIHLTDAGSKGE
ncbi:hypothetical protein FHR84_003722 [Actinopolyspora biskrensis]|uniref:ADP ribosyltransferase domain-containing protein n=1 Tax=Actinopolyspora biskrensis TaxID=1470178 RepID=A0A852Z4X3_9ACTN|nr:ADP-ribosyltransferase [Actinopolyspora biskrensis]NYH80365.1 hypothetical protein [Actinopolyspora biskrensis]